MWSSKDMKTGAMLVAVGFILGAFLFSNGSQLEAMRTSRENWKSKAETAQTEMYSFRTNCATEKKSLGETNQKQLIQAESNLRLKQSELDAAKKALIDMEAIRKEEIEKLDEQIGYLKERAEAMQRKNSDLTVMQQTSIGSIEMYAEKNGHLLTSLLDILSTAAHAEDSEVGGVANSDLQLDVMPEFDQPIEENLPDPEEIKLGAEIEAQAEINGVLVGFEPPPRAVGNAQIHEEEFQQQINEELQMDQNDDFFAEENVMADVVEGDFNLEHEMAGVHPDAAEDHIEHVVDGHIEHIPEMQEHPIDFDAAVVQEEAEFAPPMPAANEVLPIEVESEKRLSRLLNAEDEIELPKVKKKRRKRKKKKST